MNTPNPLTPYQREKLAAYHELPGKAKVDLLAAVQKLEQMRVASRPPSPDEILNQLSATGYLEIGLACYVAQLCKIKWRTK